MAQRMILMEHPDIPGSQREITESAFDAIWSRKGWKRSQPAADGTPDDDEPGDLTEQPKKAKRGKAKHQSETGTDVTTDNSEQEE